MNRFLVGGGAAALIFGVIAFLFMTLDVEAAPPMQPQNVDVALGKLLYDENCASCHGVNLEGQPDWRSAGADGVLPAPPHDETGHTWHHGDALLFNYTKVGGKATLAAQGMEFNSGMPGFSDVLTDEEIWAVLGYIKSTWSARIQEIQSVRTQGEQLRGE